MYTQKCVHYNNPCYNIFHNIIKIKSKSAYIISYYLISAYSQ